MKNLRTRLERLEQAQPPLIAPGVTMEATAEWVRRCLSKPLPLSIRDDLERLRQDGTQTERWIAETLLGSGHHLNTGGGNARLA